MCTKASTEKIPAICHTYPWYLGPNEPILVWTLIYVLNPPGFILRLRLERSQVFYSGSPTEGERSFVWFIITVYNRDIILGNYLLAGYRFNSKQNMIYRKNQFWDEIKTNQTQNSNEIQKISSKNCRCQKIITWLIIYLSTPSPHLSWVYISLKNHSPSSTKITFSFLWYKININIT